MSDVLSQLNAALVGSYRVRHEIGRGGMATVFLADDIKHERRVAIKVLRTETASAIGSERFVREIAIAAGLSHPHILPLLDSGSAGNLLYYVMPYVEGESLRSRLAREKQLTLEDAIRIVHELADALDYAHRRGVVHRDIKPENILLEEQHAVLADFGIARAIVAAGGERLTTTGVVFGTPAYMSPEQLSGTADTDGRGDQYSLACVLYEMLTGEPPFGGPTVQAIQARHMFDPVPSVRTVRPAVPQHVETAINRALSKVAVDRFDTALQFAAAVEANDVRGAEHVRTGVYKNKWLAGAGTALILLAIVVWRLLPWSASSLETQTLAVLPFDVQGQVSGAHYLGRAMAQAIAVNLATAKGLTVLTVPEVTAAETVDPSKQMIRARSLRAGRFLTGLLVRSGDSVRVSVSMSETRTGRIRWGTFTSGDERDLPACAAVIARKALDALSVAPPQQYEFVGYLTGSPRMAKSLELARAQAAVRDYDLGTGDDATISLCTKFPREPDAHALRAWMLLTKWFNAPSDYALAAFRSELSTLHQLDPHHPYFDIFQAMEARDFGKNREAVRLLSEILLRNDLAPTLRSHVLRQRAGCFFLLGSPDLAIKDGQESLGLDPVNTGGFEVLSLALISRGRSEEALARAQQGTAIAPRNYLLYHRAGSALTALSRHDEAAIAMAKACELSHGQSQCGDYAVALIRVGRASEAREAAEAAARLPATKYGQYNLAQYWTLTGNIVEALQCLKRSLSLGLADAQLFSEPNFNEIRSDPRFQKISSVVRSRLANK